MNIYVCIYTFIWTHTVYKEGNATIFEITWLSIKYTVFPDMERQIQYEFTSMKSKKEKPSNNK